VSVERINYIPGVTQLPEGFVLASEYDAPDAQQVSVTPTVGQAQVREDTTSDRRKEEAKRAEMAAAQTRKDIISEMFGEGYLKGRAAKPFSDLFGKQEPGTVTTNGYIVGDNGELLNPETGEQDFQGLAVDLGLKDKEPLDTSIEGGVNQRFKDAFEKRASKMRLDSALQKAEEKGNKNLVAAVKAEQKKTTAEREKERKQDKKDREKADKERYKEPALKEKAKDIAKGGKRRTFGGFKEGGLASKPKPKPKKMRSGGLASKK
jgi:hypothetical protein